MAIRFDDEAPKQEGKSKIKFDEPEVKTEPETPPGQIPGAGDVKAPPSTGRMAGEPSFREKAIMYATAVPTAGVVSQLIKRGTAGTRAAPYTTTLAEALTPKTLGQLTGATGVAAASALPAEFARSKAEQMGAGQTGQFLAELGGGSLVAGPMALGQRAKASMAEKLRLARGKELQPQVERLTKTAQEKAAEVVGEARAAEFAPLRELTSIEQAQRRLGGRTPVATQRQAAREQEVTTALNQLSPTGQVLSEDLGGLIQPVGRENIRRLSAARQQEAITKIKDPAFDNALTRQEQGDFIATNVNSKPIFDDAIALLERQIQATTEPYRSQLKARLDSLRGERVPLSAAEQRVEQMRAASIPGYQPKTDKTMPTTLEQAEFMRRLLTDKNLAESSGFAALDIGRRQDVANLLVEAMKRYEPRVGDYISKYREMSEPIKRATAGRGGALTEAELLAEEQALFAADKRATTNYYLDGSQERAERLLSLIGGKTPQVVNGIRGYLRTRMEGMSAKEAEKFIADNEGMLRVFPEFRPQMQQIAQAKSVAEKAPKASAEKAAAAQTRLELSEKAARSRVNLTQKERAKYEGLQQNILSAPPGKETAIAENFIKTLYNDEKIDIRDYRNLLEQVRNVQQAAKNQQEAKQSLHSLLVRLGWGFGGVGAAGTIGYIF